MLPQHDPVHKVLVLGGSRAPAAASSADERQGPAAGHQCAASMATICRPAQGPHRQVCRACSMCVLVLHTTHLLR